MSTPAGELLRGTWTDGDGLVFTDRERPEARPWIGARAESSDDYRFYLQAKAHLQCGEFNGVPQRGHCPAGAVQFLQPGETVHPAGVGATRFLQVTLSRSFLAERLDEAAVRPAGRAPSRRYRADLGLDQLARAHEAGVDRGLSGQQLYFDVLRQAILNRLLGLQAHGLRGHAAGKESLAPHTLRHVIDFVDANLGGDLRLAELARVAGVSKFHFSRALHNTLGMSPHGYVLQCRLARAHELLRRRCPVSEAARLCGFADAAHLSRSFKARFGCVPSAATGAPPR